MRIFFLSLLLSTSAHATSITYFGDSQRASRAGLLSRLNSQITTSGHSFVNGRAVCGATIGNHIRGNEGGVCRYPGVTYMNIENGRPQYVAGSGKTVQAASLIASSETTVVQLGDNHLDNPDLGGRKAAELAREILSRGKSCVWIGPAAVSATQCAARRSQKRAVSEAIKSALSNLVVNGRTCRFIDSFSLTSANPPASRDCLHYSNYQQWADAIDEEVLTALATRNQSAPPSTESNVSQ
jgi:hypothetical protein